MAVVPIVIVMEWACCDTTGTSGPCDLLAIAIGPDRVNSHPDATRTERKYKVLRAVLHTVDYFDELGTAHRVICKEAELSVELPNTVACESCVVKGEDVM